MVFNDKFWEEKVIKPCDWKIKHYYMKLFFVALVFERIALFLKDDQGMSHEAGDKVANLLLKVNSNFTVPCFCNDFKWKAFDQNSTDTCYRMYGSYRNYKEGAAACPCQSEGGSLTQVQSEEENRFVYSLLGPHRMGHPATVGEFEEENGVHVWSQSRDPMNYTNWASGHPTGVRGGMVFLGARHGRVGPQWTDTRNGLGRDDDDKSVRFDCACARRLEEEAVVTTATTAVTTTAKNIKMSSPTTKGHGADSRAYALNPYYSPVVFALRALRLRYSLQCIQ